MKKILFAFVIGLMSSSSTIPAEGAPVAAKPSKSDESISIKEDQQIARLVRWVNSNPSGSERLGMINVSIDKTGKTKNVKCVGSKSASRTASEQLRLMRFPLEDSAFREKRIKIQFVDLPATGNSKLSQRVRTVTTCGGVASGG